MSILPTNHQILDKLCQRQAFLISKDHELGATARHDRAIRILLERFPIEDPILDKDSETFGIAGGIYECKWEDLGKYDFASRHGG